MKLPYKIEDSIESKFSKLAQKMNRKKKIFYSLGLGEPNYNTPEPIIKSALKAMNQGFTKYSNSAGDVELRKKISQKLRRENNIKSKYENIIITAGSKMALYLALMSLLQPGDHIIYFTPCYTSYLPQILLSEKKIKITNLVLDKNFQVDFKQLKKKIQKNTKAILINYPHNPTGQILTKEALKNFKNILLKNKKCYLISDEIYEKITFNKAKHLSPGSVDLIKKKVITINGFSKAYAMTGWRIGYCHAPSFIIKRMTKLQQHIINNIPIFIQKAALTALVIKTDHLKNFKKTIVENYNYAFNILNKNPFFTFVKAYGGFFVFLKLNTKILSDNLCSDLLKKKNIVITPGKYFGTRFSRYIRISLSQDCLIFRKAIDIIDSYIKKKYK